MFISLVTGFKLAWVAFEKESATGAAAELVQSLLLAFLCVLIWEGSWETEGQTSSSLL